MHLLNRTVYERYDCTESPDYCHRPGAEREMTCGPLVYDNLSRLEVVRFTRKDCQCAAAALSVRYCFYTVAAMSCPLGCDAW